MGATEITTVTGERYTVDGSPQEVEALIIAAARGSILQFAWLTEAGSDACRRRQPDVSGDAASVGPAPPGAHSG